MARTTKKAPKRRIIATRSEQVDTLVSNGAVDTSLVGKAHEVENAKLAFDGHTAYHKEQIDRLNALYAEREALNLRITEAEAEATLAGAAMTHAHKVLNVRTQSLTGQAWNGVNKVAGLMSNKNVLGGGEPGPY